jgi:carnitine 3-dehydrogenase
MQALPILLRLRISPFLVSAHIPELDAGLIETITTQSDDQSSHLSISTFERLRDENLVDIIRALKGTNTGAGDTASWHDARLKRADQEHAAQGGENG